MDLSAFNQGGVAAVSCDHFSEESAHFFDALLVEQIKTGGFRTVVVGGMATDLDQFADQSGFGNLFGEICGL